LPLRKRKHTERILVGAEIGSSTIPALMPPSFLALRSAAGAENYSCQRLKDSKPRTAHV
jgi:hypothetical protein